MVSMVRAKWKKWDILDAAIEKEGWKLLLLLRLSPMVPYNLLNIAMATTKMHFWIFAIVSAIGKACQNPDCLVACCHVNPMCPYEHYAHKCLYHQLQYTSFIETQLEWLFLVCLS